MSEHLEPGPGDILQFHDGEDLPQHVAGYRWKCRARYPDQHYRILYRLLRVDAPDHWLQITQELMDRCGRLLVSGEEQANT